MTSAPRHPNAPQWQAVAYFLAGLRRCAPALAATAAAAPGHGKRSAGTGAAAAFLAFGFQALPDGNHGDNNSSIL